MPRISAASFRFQRVLVSIRRISSRSASRAAERDMSLSETLPLPLLARADSATVATESMPTGAGALTAAMGAGIAAAAGGGMIGCGGGVTGRGVDEGIVFDHWWSAAAG